MRRVALLLAVALVATAPVAGAVAPGGHAPANVSVSVSDSATAGAPGPAVAPRVGALHGFHTAVQPQATADGTVVVETVGVLAPSFVVLSLDGEVVGTAFVEETGFRTDVPVDVDADAWDDWSGAATVSATLYRDDGDGEFDPVSDRAVTDRYPGARSQATVGRLPEGAARVLAGEFDPLPVEDGSVTVRRVALAEAGHVVVRPFGGGDPLGGRTLSAGTHRNVSVAVNRSAVADRTGSVSVRIDLYRDDGDGRFDGSESPVTVGEDAVGTVTRLTTDPDGGVSIITAANETGADGAGAAATPSDDDTAASGPGFDAVTTVAALLAVAALLIVASLGRHRE